MNKIILLLGSIIILSSCASLTRGTTDAFLITSKPTNVEIRTSHGYYCMAPCALKLPRKEGFSVTASKKGFCTRTYNVISSVASPGGAAMAGNVLIGGIVGAGVDAAMGSTKDLYPNPLNVELEECPIED